MLNNKNIIAAVIAALAVFGFFAMVMPLYDGIMAARQVLSERQDRLAERTDLVAQVAKLSDEYNKNASDISKLDVLLPTNNQPDQIVSSLQDIANQSGMVLAEMGIANITSQQLDAPYKSSVISLRSSGQYEQFYNFLKLMEQSLRLYDVQSINISESTVGGSNNSSLLNFDIRVNANSIR